MSLKIGDKIIGTINKVQNNGVYVTFAFDLGYGFLPNALMPSFFNENGVFMKQIKDKIKVVISNISDDNFITLSDEKTFENEQRKLNELLEKLQLKKNIADFASIYKRGDIFEVEVLKVENSLVRIKLGNVEGIIIREETYWNEINQLEDLFFEGEVINAVYLKFEKEKLYFSVKYLNERPYDEKTYDYSLEELLKYIGHETNVFIGNAKKYGNFMFIENLYSDYENHKGKLLTDPIYGYNLRALVLNSNFLVEENNFYKIELILSPKEKRFERNQLFQFFAINIVETNNPYRSDVELAFQRNTTNPSANQRDAKLLDEIGKNMYSSKDRMFFELIQNADDAASKNGVHIIVKTDGDYLVVRHNGYSFDKDDFEAITSAANGTKKANENKTGYKGIGFKSVFTDSEQVYIKTGGYRFKFDKQEEIFQNFDRFYFDNNPMIINEDSKKEFLRLYSYQKGQFDGIHSIPWQLEPIWANQFPDELDNTFEKSNVSVALKLGVNKITGDNGYQKTIDDIISNPKFMLFLRNTKRIDFNGKSVSKTIKENIITLKNSFYDERVELFERGDFNISISNDAFKNNGIDIRLKIEAIEETTGKIIEAKFVDLHNHELENIPHKIAINNSTTISFAVSLTEDGKLNPNKNRNEISLFAFLPTLVKDFKFPIYINANFILDPPRQRILGDNPWNFYLMQEIAVKLVDWSAKLSIGGDNNSLNILLPDYFDENTADIKQLAGFFNRAYKTALEKKSFILAHSGELVKQDEIIFDKTDLSKILGASNFCTIIKTKKYLPSDIIDSSILRRKVFEKIESIGIDILSSKLINNEQLNIWYLNAPDDKKNELYEWLIKNKNECKEIINSLPVFKFGNENISRNDITRKSDYIITSEHILPIKNILSKLDYKCSNDLFSNHPLKECFSLQVEKDVFEDILKRMSVKNIELSPIEKLLLIKSLAEFNTIGTTAISQIKIFCNIQGEKTALCEMVAYKENTPKWLCEYVLCKEENFPELSKYLIESEKEFSDIVWKHFDELGPTATELYNEYKWSDSKFTNQLVDKYKNTENYKTILPIIENSDKDTQLNYLRKLESVKLYDNQIYKKESFEYRVLQIALIAIDIPSKFSILIYYNNQSIKNFSIKDEVICDYFIDAEHKKVKMSLAKLLPQYQNQSDSIEKIKNLFEVKKDLDKFFDAKEKTLQEVFNELNQLLNIPEYNFSEWNVCGNAYQYMFSTYYRKQLKKWDNANVPKIDLTKQTDDFIIELLNFLYENKVGVESPFTYWFKKYLIDKYFDCDYIFEEEQLLPAIENWADNDQKKEYLIKNRVRLKTDNSILFRQNFINNQDVQFLDLLSNDTIIAGVAFLTNSANITLPFNGENQKNILVKLLKKDIQKLTSEYDFLELSNKSQQYNSVEYTEWIKGHFPYIYLFQADMPKKILFENTLLSTYNETDYCYDKSNRKLYINGKKTIEDILFVILKEGKCDFSLDDYQSLCMKGKITISSNEIEAKEALIKKLTHQNQEKDDLIQIYITKFGPISNYDFANNINQNNSTTLSASQLDYNKSVITKPNLSEEEQIEAHKEAEQIVRRKLIQDGYDCSEWVIDDDANQFSKWHSVNQVDNIKNQKGDLINLVIKSAKGGYIFLSATDFEFLTSNSNNVLMVWDGKQVHSVTGDQIFQKESNVNLIFDTEYTPKHYYAALSKVFQYVKRTTFAVKNPSYNAYDSIRSFGMDVKTEGVQELFDDNDL